MDKTSFNELVDLAMTDTALSAVRPVVEKELLQYEIFQALDADGLLKNLVFKGGTSLRLCWGSDRLSEDLSFAGGENFSVTNMQKIKECLVKRIGDRFDFPVTSDDKTGPTGAGLVDNSRVDKWRISIKTSPESFAMPLQAITLEIANIRAHTCELAPLRINYDFLAGMPTVLVNVETLNEILADKLLTFPASLRNERRDPEGGGSTRIRHRDIWDLAWLITRNATLVPELAISKIADYRIENYSDVLDQAIERLPEIVNSRDFASQMSRLVDLPTASRTLAAGSYRSYLLTSVNGLFLEMKKVLKCFTSGEFDAVRTRAH